MALIPDTDARQGGEKGNGGQIVNECIMGICLRSKINWDNTGKERILGLIDCMFVDNILQQNRCPVDAVRATSESLSLNLN